jgi:hypothetical protein
MEARMSVCSHCRATLQKRPKESFAMFAARKFCNRRCYFDSVRNLPTLRQLNKQRYWIHRAMIRRCTDPSCKDWPEYGGRGITVCDRWLSFANFLEDMGERPDGASIDRIDNSKGYSPDNCRWADAKQQSQNRRHVIQVYTLDGRLSLKAYCAEVGLSYGTVKKRLELGWTLEDAITKPVRKMAHA